MAGKEEIRDESQGRGLPSNMQPIGEEFYRAIAEYTYDWESWFAPTGQLLWVNSAVEKLTGYTPEECLAMNDYPLPLIIPEHHGRVERIVQDAQQARSETDIEFQVRHRDGSKPWMAVAWQPMYSSRNEYLGIRASVRDISERQMMREQLRLHNEHLEQLVQERTARIVELEKHRGKMERLAALGELAAGVAHEVNNPLAGIRNAFALIKSSLSPDAKYYNMLDLIDDEIERIGNITHQMYQLYRPSQQQPARFCVRRSLLEVVALLEPAAMKGCSPGGVLEGTPGGPRSSGDSEDRTEDSDEPIPATDLRMVTKQGVSIWLTVGETVPVDSLEETEVVLREGELKQVLLNLLHNGLQASQPGDRVTIELHTTSEKLIIRVRDQGAGIAADVLPHIFDPFFSTKTEIPRQGMGLGLSVSRSLIDAMGGGIEVISKLGEGTCFQVVLPRVL